MPSQAVWEPRPWLGHRLRRVPNWLTAAGLAAGLACALPGGWRGLALATAGAALGFALLLPFHWCGAMGGGDVKLMAAFGAFLGPAGILLAAFFAAIAGGLLPLPPCCASRGRQPYRMLPPSCWGPGSVC